MEPGEIYLVDFAVAGVRPVIVVSRESLNRGRTVLIVPCTTARFEVHRHLPSCVPFRAGDFALTEDCVAQCDNLARIAIEEIMDLEAGPLGVLSGTAMREVIRAIGHVIQSDCEPE